MESQLRRLANATLVYGIGGVLSRSLSLFTLPLFTAYLTPTDFGISAMLGLVSLVLVPIFSLGIGLSAGICYFDSKDPKHRADVIWSAFAVLLVSSLILALLGTALAGEISKIALQTDGYRQLVIISLLTSCLTILVIPFTLYFQFEEKAKSLQILTISTTCLSIGFSIALVVLLQMGIYGWLQAALMGQASSFMLFLIAALRDSRPRFNRTSARDLLRHGLPLVPAFGFLFILQQANKYVLQSDRGLSEVGVYTIGYNFGMIIALPISGFQSAWMPYFQSFIDRQDEAGPLFGRITTYYVLGFGSLTLLFFIAAKPLVMLLTRSPFYDAYSVIGLAATSQFLYGLWSVLLPAVYFAKKTKYVTLLQGAAAFVTMGLNLLLIPRLGVLGAALPLALGPFVMVVLQSLWNKNRMAPSLFIQYDSRRIWSFAALYVVIAALTTAPRELSLFGEIAMAAAECIGVSLILWRLLTQQEQAILRSLPKRMLLRARTTEPDAA